MVRPKSEGPTRTEPVQVRLLPLERRFLEHAASLDGAEALRELGLAKFPLSTFLRAGGLERARRITGMTLEEFKAKEHAEGKRKRGAKAE